MNHETIPVRLSHLLSHCSPGAIVRGAGVSGGLLVVMDTRRWVDGRGEPGGEEIPYVDGVRSALGIDEALRKPPVARERENGSIEGVCIPAMRFPTWVMCSGCGLLHRNPWRGLQENEQPRCRKCGKETLREQLPWVFVHSDGYLADVPWHFIAHRETRGPAKQPCKPDSWSPYLILREIEGQAGRYEVSCSRCGAAGRFKPGDCLPYGRTRIQPWAREIPALEEHAAPGMVLDVNDARVHIPASAGALVIPPESRICRGTVLDRVYCNSRLRRNLEAPNPIRRGNEIRKAAEELRCPPAEIEKALEEIENGYPLYGRSVTVNDLLESEFHALVREIDDFDEGEDFVTRHWTEDWRAQAAQLPAEALLERRLARLVTRLVEVRRLKEVQVFLGFRRVGGDENELVPPDLVGKSPWLPAVELYGEGLFFVLDEAVLRRWEAHPAVGKRAAEFKKRFKDAAFDFRPEIAVSPRFLLLHTLSHLLIRRVEAVSGYPAASLKERIYATPTPGREMAGVLIYVAVPDDAGSLGGLSELARPENFLKLLGDAFKHADWCSLDPVCGESEGHGPGFLNRAACHGCALIPEPSCACGNVLLDRCFVRGAGDADGAGDGFPPFLEFVDGGEARGK